MAKKRLVQGVAGCGKTYYIANEFEAEKKVLLISFTNENVKNIQQELVKRFDGYIPHTITLKTFDSFILEDLIYPFPRMINGLFTGLNIERLVCGALESPKKKTRYNDEAFLYGKDSVKKYFTNDHELYNETACYLVSDLYKVNPNWNQVIKRLELVYDEIYIDEYQDFRTKKYEILEALIKRFNKPITLVGDYYQQGLSGKVKSGKPFKGNTYDSHHSNMAQLGLEIDAETLAKTRRCSIAVSEKINEFYDFPFETISSAAGEIRNLDASELDTYLSDDAIPKLIEKNASSYKENFINYSYSKGNTYDNVVIIQTGKVNKTNAYYVALSRAKYSVYLIEKNKWDSVKTKYSKTLTC